MFFQDDKLNEPAHRLIMFVIKLSPCYQDPSHLNLFSFPPRTNEITRSSALATVKFFKALERSLRLEQHGNRRPILAGLPVG